MIVANIKLDSIGVNLNSLYQVEYICSFSEYFEKHFKTYLTQMLIAYQNCETQTCSLFIFIVNTEAKKVWSMFLQTFQQVIYSSFLLCVGPLWTEGV